MSMLTHVVLMQLRADAAPAAVAELSARLRDLAETIVGPDACVVGPNVTHEPFARGYDFGFVIRFPDRGALAVYHDHPGHVAVSEAILRLSAEFLVFDFEG